MIAISSVPEYPWISAFTGNADNLAVVPNPYGSNVGIMTFWSRLGNVYTHFRDLYKFQRITEESQTASMRKYLGPDLPSVREVEKSVALVFVNTDHVLYGVKPLVPTLVQIAGIQVQTYEDVLPGVSMRGKKLGSFECSWNGFSFSFLSRSLESGWTRALTELCTLLSAR